MEYVKIDNVIIIGTNLKTIGFLNTEYIKNRFNQYFCGFDLIENLETNEDNYFPIIIQFKYIKINDYQKELLDKIYEFINYFKYKKTMNIRVNLNEIWKIKKSPSSLLLEEEYMMKRDEENVRIIKNKKDCDYVIKTRLKSLSMIDKKLNIINKFIMKIDNMELRDVEKMYGLESKRQEEYRFGIPPMPPPLKRQCTDPEAFEFTHGVTFRECYP